MLNVSSVESTLSPERYKLTSLPKYNPLVAEVVLVPILSAPVALPLP